MAGEEQQVYPKVAANAVNRYRDKANYDVETIHSIINTAPVAHVSFVPDPSQPIPVILPMIARVGQFPGSDEAAVYVHGYVSARLFRPRTSSNPDEEGYPICIAATKIVGFVLSLTPYSHNFDYRSAIVHGHASLLDPATDYDETIFAMQLITNGMVPQRWENSRTPPDKAEISATRILKVRIDSASAKINDSGVKEEAKDLKDEKTRETTWTGVIPYVETLGTPIPAPTNKVAGVPDYMQNHIQAHNEKALEIAGGGGQKGFMSKLVSSVFGS